MVRSSTIDVTTDREHLMCDGFSLSETIRLGNFVFIADFFGSLSLSPRIGHTGSTFMGSTRNEASTL
jgi:hypothetical protein